MDKNKIKQHVGYEAVDRFVSSGMSVGLGTGSTAVWAVRRLGELLQSGKLHDIKAYATSSQIVQECRRLGITLFDINGPRIAGRLDITIDGADEIDIRLNLTKGGGAALTIEKIAAYASEKLIIIADATKKVEKLGLTFPVPLEVLPAALLPVTNVLNEIGFDPELRMAVKKMGPVITDNGNYILDAHSKMAFNPVEMETELNCIPGVIENGLFTRYRGSILLGAADGAIETFEKSGL